MWFLPGLMIVMERTSWLEAHMLCVGKREGHGCERVAVWCGTWVCSANSPTVLELQLLKYIVMPSLASVSRWLLVWYRSVPLCVCVLPRRLVVGLVCEAVMTMAASACAQEIQCVIPG